MSFFICDLCGNRKAVKKSVRGTLFRPWEISLAFGRNPLGMWTKASSIIASAVSPENNTTLLSGVIFLPIGIPMVFRRAPDLLERM